MCFAASGCAIFMLVLKTALARVVVDTGIGDPQYICVVKSVFGQKFANHCFLSFVVEKVEG